MMGANRWPRGRPRYFLLFLSSAAAAIFPGTLIVCNQYEAARVSGQVASHTSKQLDFHKANVTPSGLFLRRHEACGFQPGRDEKFGGSTHYYKYMGCVKVSLKIMSYYVPQILYNCNNCMLNCFSTRIFYC